MIIITLRKQVLCAAIAAACVSPSVASQLAEEFRLLETEQTFLNDGTQAPAIVATGPDGETRYEIRSGYAVVQGDIVLGKVLNDGDQPILSRGIGRTSKIDRWIDGIVYYELSPDLPQSGLDKAREAVAHWNQFSTLRFTERTGALQESQPDYILFEPSSGCASWVGKIGGEQAVWVGETCTAGSVIHEIGHAIGFFHEHTRSDRDSFITVQMNNIVEGKEFNFDVIDAGAEDLGEYDYGSIMHYGDAFFSRNGQATITVPDGVSIGQREALSPIDLASVNQMYGTDLLLSYSTSSNGNSTDISFTVNNIGDNGANTISLAIPTAMVNGMQSFSGSGWNCSSGEMQTSCLLDTLADGAESSLAITMAAGAVDENDLQAHLSSKTHDFDLSNNGSLPLVTSTETSIAEQSSTEPVVAETDVDAALPDQDSDGVAELPSPAPVAVPVTSNPVTTGTTVPTVATVANQAPTSISTNDSVASGDTDPANLELGAAQAGESGGGGSAGWPLLLALFGYLNIARKRLQKA